MPTAASAATPGYYEFGWEGAGISGTSHGGILIQNGVSYVSEHVVENFGLEMSWDESGERAAFRSVKREFAVRIGSKTAVMDGELVELPGSAFPA